MRTVLTLAVDSFDSAGNLVGSLLGMRASARPVDPHDLVEHVVTNLPEQWAQMTYDELVAAREAVQAVDTRPWDQLSLW